MSLNFALMGKLGNLLKPFIGVVPLAVSAGTRNGAAINRLVNGSMAAGLELTVVTGVETGAPSARTVDAKIQDSANGSTGWADYIPPDQATVAAIAQITAASSVARVSVNLAGAKQFVRVADTTAFTAGSSPTLNVGSIVQLHGFDRTPQA
jgi:hypothetical protein